MTGLTNTPVRSSARRIAARLALSLLIAAGFVWALRQGGLSFMPANAWSRTAWWGLPGYMGFVALAVVMRTVRWYYLLEPLSSTLKRGRVFGVGLIGFSAIFFAPLRLGEFVRPYALSRDGDVTFVQAVGTVTAERIIDGLVVMAMSAIALALSTPLLPAPTHVGNLPIPVALVPGAIVAAGLVFAGAFAAMALFYVARDKMRRLVGAVVGVFSKRFADFCSSLVERLAESLTFLPSWRLLLPFLRETVLYWLLMGAAQYTLLRAVGLEATLPQGMVLIGVTGLGSLLPAGPGFFGAFQVAAYTAIAMYHVEKEVLTEGAVFVFVAYVGSVSMNALQGLLGMLLLARIPPSSAR